MRLIWVLVISVSLSIIRVSSTNTTSSSCPMDLNYVRSVPWNTSDCHNTPQAASRALCCQTLLSLYGIALAQHLKETSLFQLQDLPTSISCLSDFQLKLTSLSLPSNLTSICFSPLQFVITPNVCAGIESKKNWVDKLGSNTTLIDRACSPDLTDLSACDTCVAAGLRIQAQLIAIDGNASHSRNCFYFTILYAAGIANEFGPLSYGAMTCTFSLQLISPSGSTGNGHSSLVFGLIGAGVAVLAMSCLLGLYYWYDRRRKKVESSGFEMEEQEIRPRKRPNATSIWFKREELERATDNFSQRNFIGRGGSGMVFKGTLSDGAVVAVKRLIESDFEGHAEFCNEVEIISNLKHRNLVPLRGSCVIDEEETKVYGENERYLVYDYMPNGNLEDHLFLSPDSMKSIGRTPLTWPQRKSIILDVAKGLAYLHYGVKPAIYHRDIKATNILLDAYMKARMGKVDEAFDASLLKKGENGEMNPRGIMERFVLVGILCAHVMVALRPTILDALKMLEGDLEVPTIPDRPMPLGHPSFGEDATDITTMPILR
ncbi:hypothetical protein V2J09_008174 [Rumex salicifolius]